MRDAPTKSLKEEFVGGMGQSNISKDVVMKDVPKAWSKAAFALLMEQNNLKRHAVMRDAPTKPRQEGSVCDILCTERRRGDL
mmetsp:Transcript_43222/g.77679  ORF Transcript_43222/g.77679 Transcript_43222/m.77679 type:complete len:82 (-) Transcript_43222:111-356(-)